MRKNFIKIFSLLLVFVVASCDDKDNDDDVIVPENYNDGQTGSLTDIEGNVYGTVKIGSWWWMSENLRTKTYADGTPISANGVFVYNDDESYAETHGRLYTLSAARRGGNTTTVPSERQGCCPDGWSLPTDEQWKLLEIRLGMPRGLADQLNFRSELAGRIKSTSTHWLSPNVGAINDIGFNALPTGYRRNAPLNDPNSPYNGQIYLSDSLNAYFWTATNGSSAESPELAGTTISRVLNYSFPSIGRIGQNRSFALSVRCVRNTPED